MPKEAERPRKRRTRQSEAEEQRQSKLGLNNVQKDPERIAIRQSLRELMTKTRKASGACIAKDSELLQELHNEYDEIHKNVLQPSEANLDLQELSLLAHITSEGTKFMSERMNTVSVDDYAAKIKAYFNLVEVDQDGDGEVANINWSMLGIHPLNTLLNVRTPDFLPNVFQLDLTPSERKARARPVRNMNAEATYVEPVASTDQLVKTQTESRISLLLKILQKQAPDQRGIPLFTLVVNPGSFGQTVENLFDLSFLIGNGRAEFDTIDEEVYVKTGSPCSDAELQAGTITPQQSIITMTYALWKEAIELYQIKAPTIPHRLNF